VPNSAERGRVFERDAERCGNQNVVDKIEIEETSLEVTLTQRDVNGFQLMVDRCPIFRVSQGFRGGPCSGPIRLDRSRSGR
jgi:hypothetical protein